MNVFTANLHKNEKRCILLFICYMYTLLINFTILLAQYRYNLSVLASNTTTMETSFIVKLCNLDNNDSESIGINDSESIGIDDSKSIDVDDNKKLVDPAKRKKVSKLWRQILLKWKWIVGGVFTILLSFIVIFCVAYAGENVKSLVQKNVPHSNLMTNSTSPFDAVNNNQSIVIKSKNSSIFKNFLNEPCCSCNSGFNALEFMFGKPEYIELYKKIYKNGPLFVDTKNVVYKNCIKEPHEEMIKFLLNLSDNLKSTATVVNAFLVREIQNSTGDKLGFFDNVTKNDIIDFNKAISQDNCQNTKNDLTTSYFIDLFKNDFIFSKMIFVKKYDLYNESEDYFFEFLTLWTQHVKNINKKNDEIICKLSINRYKLALGKMHELLSKKLKNMTVDQKLKLEDLYLKIYKLDSIMSKITGKLHKLFGIDKSQLQNFKNSSNYFDILLDILLFGTYHDLFAK